MGVELLRPLASLVLLCGCGDGIDVPADGSSIDPTPGLVRIHVGDGISGARVLFQNRDSSLVLATRTGMDGSANAYMSGTGFVTVVLGGELWTYGGVEPGDDLRLGAPASTGNAVIDLHVPPDSDAASYWLHTSCSQYQEVTGAEAGGRTTFLPPCAAGPADLLLITRELGFSVIAHFTARLDAELGTEGAPSLIELSGPYLPPVASRITLDDVPGSIGFLYAHQEVVGSHGPLFDSSAFAQTVIDATSVPSVTIPMPLVPGTRLVTYLDDVGSFGSNSLLHYIQWVPATADTRIDLGAAALPVIPSPPSWDPIRHAITWSEAPAPLTPEATIADLRFGNGLVWHVLGPRERGQGTALALPVLPEADLDPGAQPVVATRFTTIASTTGFAAYRATLLGWAPKQRWPIEYGSGRVIYNELVPR